MTVASIDADDRLGGCCKYPEEGGGSCDDQARKDSRGKKKMARTQ